MNDQRQQYVEYAAQMAQQYGLPIDLFLGQLENESNFNPNAVSKTGAVGIGQFKKNWHPVGTWKFQSDADYNDPYKSMESAAMYMKSLQDQYKGNYDAALAHYNGGTAQGKLVASGGVPDREETANYLPRIKNRASNYASYMGNASPNSGYSMAMAPQMPQQPSYQSAMMPQQPMGGGNPYARMSAPQQQPQYQAPQPPPMPQPEPMYQYQPEQPQSFGQSNNPYRSPYGR